jgi:hypothetical protein
MEFREPEPILFYFERGKLSDLVAKPKDGKTTFILLGIAAMLRGERFLGLPTKLTRVLYLTEQPRRSFHDKLQRVGITDGDAFRALFVTDLHGLDWSQTCSIVREECRAHDVGLLVIDTLSKSAKVSDENDAGEALRVCGPLQLIAEDNVAVAALRHAGKGDTNHGEIVDSGRGSSAFSGEFDLCTVLSRAPGSGHPNRRKLRSVSRDDNVPEIMFIELVDGHYVAEGSAANVEYRSARTAWLERLPSSKAAALPLRELMKIDGTTFSERTAGRAIEDLCREGVAAGEKGVGRAKRCDQAAYWRLDGDRAAGSGS